MLNDILLNIFIWARTTMSQHDNKIKLLRSLDLFSKLREYELDIIAKYGELIQVNKGDVIFSQDSPAHEIYIVQEGQIGIISTDELNNFQVAQVVSGESFGELDFLGRTKRSASALADLDSLLLRFPAEKYTAEDIFYEHPYVSANLLFRLLGIICERIWNVNKLVFEKSQWLSDLHKKLLLDKVTGLYNQTYLNENFINLTPKLGEQAALLMIKPDNFKSINDKYGHEAGDHALNLIASYLQSELRLDDIGIRYKSDEFAAILVDIPKNDAVHQAEQIHSAFKEMNLKGITGSNTARIKVSIGIAIYPDDTRDSKQLVQIAHKKMQKARHLGGNTIIV